MPRKLKKKNNINLSAAKVMLSPQSQQLQKKKLISNKAKAKKRSV